MQTLKHLPEYTKDKIYVGGTIYGGNIQSTTTETLLSFMLNKFKWATVVNAILRISYRLEWLTITFKCQIAFYHHLIHIFFWQKKARYHNKAYVLHAIKNPPHSKMVKRTEIISLAFIWKTN